MYVNAQFRYLLQAQSYLDSVQSSNPEARIFQIGKLIKDSTVEIHPFYVGTGQSISKLLRDSHEYPDGLHVNVQEYMHKNTRTPFVVDSEWLNVIPMTRCEQFAAISAIVDAFLRFISISILNPGPSITRDDVCVKEACSIDGTKSSFHINIFNLIFATLEDDMCNFMFYFCCWIRENRIDYPNIPEAAFYSTPQTNKIINDNNGRKTSDQVWSTICNEIKYLWSIGKLHPAKCLFIDLGIYGAGHAIRTCGSTKPGGKPRFLRPCLVTNYWQIHCPSFIDDISLNAPAPPKLHRQAWMLTSLLTRSHLANGTVYVPLVTGRTQPKSTCRRTIVATPVDPIFTLDTTSYRWIHVGVHGSSHIDLVDTNPVDHDNDDVIYQNDTMYQDDNDVLMDLEHDYDEPFFCRYVCNDDRDDAFITMFKRVNGVWFDARNDRRCTADECAHIDIERDASTMSRPDNYSWCMQVLWNMRKLGLEHMQMCTSVDDDGHPIDYTMLFEQCADNLRVQGTDIQIKCNESRAQLLMFSGSHVTLHREFPLVNGTTERAVKLDDIVSHTTVFCPVHEATWWNRNPSAFVDISPSGMRYLHCSTCNNTIWESPRNDTYIGYDVNDGIRELGSECVHFIHKPYFKLKHLIGVKDALVGNFDDNDNDSDIDMLDESDNSDHDNKRTRQIYFGKPKTFIGRSAMGTGKSELTQSLAIKNAEYIMEMLGCSATKQLGILNVTPRTGLSGTTSHNLDMIDYKDLEGLIDNVRHRGHVNADHMSHSELLCLQNRLTICLNSVSKLADRKEPYDIVILDEATTTALSFISPYLLPHLQKTLDVLFKILREARLRILLAADLDALTLQTILPDVDWNAPMDDVRITINTGGIGGIKEHDSYMSNDLHAVCRVLKMKLLEGKSVYIPTNRARFAEALVAFCKLQGLRDDEIVILSSTSPQSLKDSMMNWPRWTLGYAVEGDPDFPPGRQQRPVVRVFIASPLFGLGYNVSGIIFDITIGIYPKYPIIDTLNAQQAARVRGVKEKALIFCYPDQTFDGCDTSFSTAAMEANVQRAVAEYDAELDAAEIIPPDLKTPSVRRFAIIKRVEQKVAEMYGMYIFIALIESATGRRPMHLMSWLCNKGVGPIRHLPPLSDIEVDILSAGSDIGDDDDAPVMRDEMVQLCNMVLRGSDELRPIDHARVKLFSNLPIPPGLLVETERKMCLLKSYDRLLMVMDVMAYNGTRILQLRDVQKRNASAGVSTVTPSDRLLQRYTVFDTWANLVIKYLVLSDIEVYSHPEGDGAALFTNMIYAWLANASSEDGIFTMVFDVMHTAQLKADVEDILQNISNLQYADADVDVWFNTKIMKTMCKCNSFCEARIGHVIGKGFKALLGLSNVKIHSTKGKGKVYIKINRLQRIVSLACVRRIGLNASSISNMGVDDYRTLDAFRNAIHLGQIMPLDEKISDLCDIHI
ncbi:hypothetical protein BC936DRAFT_139146 [Jimgerdemannia flammicorona]|uniref:Replication origin-binding protein domain-containing protein n=1 Tax=Jimgerdemannia flammicorona TaxID=994334 RepID=A0A433BAJ7_9FUNG|nr:hypothetical protein BC936DRAFT_139146 [Jimgerdemannia flammicorona]